MRALAARERGSSHQRVEPPTGSRKATGREIDPRRGREDLRTGPVRMKGTPFAERLTEHGPAGGARGAQGESAHRNLWASPANRRAKHRFEISEPRECAPRSVRAARFGTFDRESETRALPLREAGEVRRGSPMESRKEHPDRRGKVSGSRFRKEAASEILDAKGRERFGQSSRLLRPSNAAALGPKRLRGDARG